MTFRTPSPALYFGSLLIAAPIAYLVYWVLQTQHLSGNGLIVLATGLFIGHLIAAFSRPSAAQASSRQQNANASAPTASSGDTISLYVGNLAYSAQRDELQALFAQHGSVASVRIMTDRATRRPRGYAFVEMELNAGREALSQLDNVEFCGRALRVSEAKQRNTSD